MGRGPIAREVECSPNLEVRVRLQHRVVLSPMVLQLRGRSGSRKAMNAFAISGSWGSVRRNVRPSAATMVNRSRWSWKFCSGSGWSRRGDLLGHLDRNAELRCQPLSYRVNFRKRGNDHNPISGDLCIRTPHPSMTSNHGDMMMGRLVDPRRMGDTNHDLTHCQRLCS